MRFKQLSRITLSSLVLSTALVGCKAGFDDLTETTNSDDPTFVGPGSHWELVLKDNTDKDFTLKRKSSVSASSNDISIEGTYEKLNTGFTKLDITSNSGATGRSNGDTLVAIEVADYAVFLLPVVTSSNQLIATIEKTDCPENDINANWVLFNGADNLSATDENTAFFGQYQYSINSTQVNLTTRYSLVNKSADQTLDSVSIAGDGCSNGIDDTNSTVHYISDTEAGIVYNNTDNSSNSEMMLAIDRVGILPLSDLNDDYIGFIYDSNLTSGEQAFAISGNCSDGNCTFNEVTDISSGTTNSTVYTINFDGADAISSGLITADILNGNEDLGEMGCAVDKAVKSTSKNLIVCVGQSPSDNSKLLNLFLFEK